MNYGQPLPGYSTQQPPQQMQIVLQQQPMVQQPMVQQPGQQTFQVQLQRNPMQLQCPNCKQCVSVVINYH